MSNINPIGLNLPSSASAGHASAGAWEDLYHQEIELGLLLVLFQRLENKTLIEVGAEQGAFLRSFLNAGASEVFAFEPYPAHFAHLLEKYSKDTRVRLYDFAVGERDEAVKLRIATGNSGQKFDYHHTLIPFAQTPTVQWQSEIDVTCRTLGSLSADGTIPARTGILKTDTEGNDLAVIAGMGALYSDLLLIEFWEDLPEVYGKCPYTIEDLGKLLRLRGYSNFVIFKRNDEFNALQLNDERLCPGDWGNILYVHDSVFADLAPVIFQTVADAQNALIGKALEFRAECNRRSDVISNLKRDADERLNLINTLTAECNRLRSLHSPLFAKISRFFPRLRRSIRKRTIDRLDKTFWMQPGILFQYAPRKMQLEKFPKPSLPESALPSIAMVTPSFNQGCYLERTIQSILSQEYPRLQYIIQDGGSSDISVEIIKRYESKLVAWESAPDDGHSEAVNVGFKKCRGEIMAWLNSDDELMPGALRYIAEYFTTHPGVDAIYGHRVVVDENDGEVGRWALPRHDAEMLKWADYVPQETLFWRRNLWDKVGGVDSSFHFALDWDLLVRFQKAGARIVRLPYFLGCFRTHPRQKTCTEMVNSTGDREMSRILQSIHGRAISPLDLERHVRRYCMKSALTAYLLSKGIRV